MYKKTDTNGDANLPWPLQDFLQVWSEYRTEAGILNLLSEDPLWDFVPQINERMEHVYTATFIGFWMNSGQMAFPAVTTQNSTFRKENRSVRGGQSVRDAFLKKGADWITVLDLSGRFEMIELMNLTHNIPQSLAESGPDASRERENFSREQRDEYKGSQFGKPACAWLDTYYVAQAPNPVTLGQRFWSMLRG
jgi:hypothetical protein